MMVNILLCDLNVTGLYIMAMMGDTRLAGLYLQKICPKIDPMSLGRETPLRWAALSGTMVKFFPEKAPDTNAKTTSRETPL